MKLQFSDEYLTVNFFLYRNGNVIVQYTAYTISH